MIRPKKLIKAFRFATEGIGYTVKHDQNLRVHFIAAFLVVLASLYLKVSPFEMGILGIMILLVIMAEMINSAIEKMVDLITKEYRVEAKIAKDVSSGMVLITVLGSIIVGVLIFLPYIIRMF